MYNYLIVAEKKTLAEDIAKAFKSYKFQKNHFYAEDPQIGTAKIFWLFGHVLKVDVNQTFENAGYPEKFPVFPEKLIFIPEANRKQLVFELGEEIKKGDWKHVVNAGDPDREGELLVREVLNYFGVDDDKVLRLWFNSQERLALRKALLSLQPSKSFYHVYVAGLARQIGDLWFGINSSRKLHQLTKNNNLSVGRVQTSVLKLIVDRYFEVKNFKPEDYYVVWIEVEKNNRLVKARYISEKEGLVKQEEANKVYEAIKNQKIATVEKIEKSKHKKSPPNLYILSSLIKDAGQFGLSAQNTMSIVQRLYEQYKCISYPRTESCYLATADRPEVERVLRKLEREELIKSIPARIFNDKDVSEAGHHAIIPINKLPEIEKVTKEERLIYDLILKRFIAQFYPDYEYELTKVIFSCGGYRFRAVGKVDLVLGWKEVYKDYKNLEKDEKTKDEDFQEGLPVFVEKEKVRKKKDGIEKKQTTPPPYYTSSTLVAEMKKKGLGTEATRSTFEPLLLRREYVYRDKKNRLFPTAKGIKLMEMVKEMGFISPEYTAQWERLLDEIFRKKKVELKKSFLEGIKELTQDFFQRMQKVKSFEGLKREDVQKTNEKDFLQRKSDKSFKKFSSVSKFKKKFSKKKEKESH